MVYVVQEVAGRNILPATEYGELEILLPPGQIAFQPDLSVRRLHKKLKNITGKDHLLLIGDPAAIALAAMIAGQYTRGELQFLKWDREHKQYFVIKVSINEEVANAS